MKAKYFISSGITLAVIGIILVSGCIQQKPQEMTTSQNPKTLTLSPNAIQIISIDNHSPLSIVCSSGEHSTCYGITYVFKDGTYYPISGWDVKGFVDFTQFSKITNGASSLDISKFIDYIYQVNIVQFDIDGHPAEIGNSIPYVERNPEKSMFSNRFHITLNGVLPTESHIVKATFKLEQQYLHITSNQVEVTYSMPKLC